MSIYTGDWVQGKTREGELIHGFVETLDGARDVVTIHVVQSDNEARIGESVAVPDSWIKPLPAASLKDQPLVLDVIDLALSTRDKEWFMELTQGSAPGRQTVPRVDSDLLSRAAFSNRLGKLA